MSQHPNSNPILKDASEGHLSCLAYAQRVLNQATSEGFHWASRAECWEKVQEETAELAVEIESNDREKLQEELGDLLLTIVSFADLEELDAEEVLKKATDKFARRYHFLQLEAASMNKKVHELSRSEKEAAWQNAKRLAS